jgi:hypothetical protein
MKWQVCEKRISQSVSSYRKGRCINYFGLSVFLNYPCIPSPSISPGNREYTVVPTILFESPNGPSDEKCLWPKKPLIRPRQTVRSAVQEISRFWWNSKVHHRVHKRIRHSSLSRNINTVHTLPHYFLNIHFNIIFSSTPRSSKGVSLQVHKPKLFTYLSYILHMSHIPPISPSLIWSS